MNELVMGELKSVYRETEKLSRCFKLVNINNFAAAKFQRLLRQVKTYQGFVFSVEKVILRNYNPSIEAENLLLLQDYELSIRLINSTIKKFEDAKKFEDSTVVMPPSFDPQQIAKSFVQEMQKTQTDRINYDVLSSRLTGLLQQASQKAVMHAWDAEDPRIQFPERKQAFHDEIAGLSEKIATIRGRCDSIAVDLGFIRDLFMRFIEQEKQRKKESERERSGQEQLEHSDKLAIEQ